MSIDNRTVHQGWDKLDPCRVKVKKGGSACIPGLKAGDFTLRPLHSHKLSNILNDIANHNNITKQELIDLFR